MGWVAYKAVWPDGTIKPLIFPVIENQINIGTDYFTMDMLLAQYPDFPVESNIFTNIPEKWESAGFGNTIDVRLYSNGVWTLENGSYIQIEDDGDVGSPNRYTFVAHLSTGETWVSAKVNATNTGVFPPCIITNLIEGRSVAGGTSYMTLYRDSVTEFKFPTGTIPTHIAASPFTDFFQGLTPLVENGDPFGDGGITEPGGGEGDFNGTSTPISIPALPTLSAVDAGFITLFNPSLAEMNNLASYMWSDLFDVNGWKKVFADPMNAILGLSIVPVNVPSSGTKPVKVGNISTGVNMTVASSQYVEVDCGTLNINEYWGAYLDYDPYTKAEIYLPYIGIHPISTDDIMNKPLRVVYHIDILSGACCAYLQCGGTVLYSFIGQCASSIPITGDNWTNVINGAISIAGAIGSMVATGGATAPMSAGTIASTAVNTMKSNIEKSGSMSGTGGMLGVQTPYMILTRPRQALPFNQNSFMGYPSFINESLSGLSGYTEVESIHLENVPATEQELSEIETLLKSGVIF